MNTTNTAQTAATLATATALAIALTMASAIAPTTASAKKPDPYSVTATHSTDAGAGDFAVELAHLKARWAQIYAHSLGR
jgi:hypothetical protein